MHDKNIEVIIQWLLFINPIAYDEDKLRQLSVEEIEKQFVLARETQRQYEEE
ncbi:MULTISPECIES: hypothetical protein [Staphylococcus]|uniref:hypothetical protein n=1 Tax=Staphylococcus TaxID=1279 RepID=UPI0015D77E1D|nr:MULTISPECIES: hypothetical protein [Staphylococcus]MCI8363273.1 hypothetical protein [Clostridia bacterium]MCQ9841459.1 hypothetical protein [Staphylococcus aureus]WEH49732.1 hypothetical protein LZ183_14445 [Staphylococcus aureus]